MKTALPAGFVLMTALVAAQSPSKVDFAKDVQPILRANCYSCHGPALQSGNFRLDRRRDSMPNRVGANGARIVPEKSEVSRVYLRIAGSQAGLQMPPSGPLTPEEIGIIKTWIDQGAEWPDELAGETPSAPEDPQAASLIDAIRLGNHAAFNRILRANPRAAQSKGSGGVTPLMTAALYGDAEAVRLLLQKGADVNARNDVGVTALLWSVDDVRTTQLLLEHGADVNVRSADGRTALGLAALRIGASDVVKALLDKGAKLQGEPVLARAAAAGDEPLMRLLIDRGAERRPLPDDLAMRTGCASCLDLLLQFAERPDLNRALSTAARFGNSSGVRLLLDRGAEPTGEILGLAARSEKVPADVVALLLDRGIRADGALDAALLHGETAVVAALRKAGVKEAAVSPVDVKRPASARSAPAAVEKSLPLLQHADVVFLQKAGCLSCHNNSLFLIAAAAARRNGFRVDETKLQSQLKLSGAYIESFRERVLQDIPIPGSVDTIGYILAGLAAVNYPADVATDALARFLKRRQGIDGGWRIVGARPPIESSDIEATAIAMRSLQVYAPRPQKAEYAKAVDRAAKWLAKARPESTEDHAFLLLGLTWARGNRDLIRKAAEQLAAMQQPDGGWRQIPTLATDAYATGLALTALAESGTLRVTDSVYRKGVEFLLKTQLEDGSWYVRKRTAPVQPYFDSEFPHGPDQFISTAATNWAVMALARVAR